ncbi:MAG TPA: flavodoxin family protein [Methylophilaceae bacterium]|nr:flavodoxin family protein [Methylophilaceae bacterium]
MADTTTPEFGNLGALFINCTLERSPNVSHTERLMRVSMEIMEKQGVQVDYFRAVDFAIAPGMEADMRKSGYDRDDWPALFERVKQADIVVIGSPIWLGEQSSICTLVIERLYALSSEVNDKGQYYYYGKVGGCIVTGNEDGGKNVSKYVLFSLQHIGFTIPPQADAYWVGPAGPGPSYGDESSDGPVGHDNDFTQQLVTFSSWNMMHMASMLKKAGGIPAYGNVQEAWENGERYGHPYF